MLPSATSLRSMASEPNVKVMPTEQQDAAVLAPTAVPEQIEHAPIPAAVPAELPAPQRQDSPSQEAQCEAPSPEGSDDNWEAEDDQEGDEYDSSEWDSDEPKRPRKVFRQGERQSMRVARAQHVQQQSQPARLSRSSAAAAASVQPGAVSDKGGKSAGEGTETAGGSASDNDSGWSSDEEEEVVARNLTPEQVAEDTAAVRNMPELTAILDFLFVFRRPLGLKTPITFNTLLEALVVSPGPGVLADLHLELLKGLVSSPKLTLDTWQHYLSQRFRHVWSQLSYTQGDPPFQAKQRSAPAAYAALSSCDRVHALKLLCDLRLEKDDLREAVDSALAPSNTRGRPSQSQSAAPAGRASRGSVAASSRGNTPAVEDDDLISPEEVRREPIGTDSEGRTYWWMDWCETTPQGTGLNLGSILVRAGPPKASPKPEPPKPRPTEPVKVEAPAQATAGVKQEEKEAQQDGAPAVKPAAKGRGKGQAQKKSEGAAAPGKEANENGPLAKADDEGEQPPQQQGGEVKEEQHVKDEKGEGKTSAQGQGNGEGASMEVDVEPPAKAKTSRASTAKAASAPEGSKPEPKAGKGKGKGAGAGQEQEGEGQQGKEKQEGEGGDAEGSEDSGSDQGEKKRKGRGSGSGKAGPPSKKARSAAGKEALGEGTPGRATRGSRAAEAAQEKKPRGRPPAASKGSEAASKAAKTSGKGEAAASQGKGAKRRREVSPVKSEGKGAQDSEGAAGRRTRSGGSTAAADKTAGNKKDARAAKGGKQASEPADAAQGKTAGSNKAAGGSAKGKGRGGKKEKEPALRFFQTYQLPPSAVPGSWEVVGSSMEELEAVAAQLEATGKPADKRVAEHITSVIVAQLQERADAEERARKGRERAAKLLGVQLGGVIVSGGRARKQVNYSDAAYDQAIKQALRGGGREKSVEGEDRGRQPPKAAPLPPAAPPPRPMEFELLALDMSAPSGLKGLQIKSQAEQAAELAAAKRAREKEERRRLKALKSSKGEAGASDKEGTQPPEEPRFVAEQQQQAQQQELEQRQPEQRLEQQQDGAGIMATAHCTDDARHSNGQQAELPDGLGGSAQGGAHACTGVEELPVSAPAEALQGNHPPHVAVPEIAVPQQQPGAS